MYAQLIQQMIWARTSTQAALDYAITFEVQLRRSQEKETADEIARHIEQLKMSIASLNITLHGHE